MTIKKIKNFYKESHDLDSYYFDLIEYKYFNGPFVGSFKDFIKKREKIKMKYDKEIKNLDKYNNLSFDKIYIIANKLSKIAITSTNKKELINTFNEIKNLTSDVSFINGSSFEIRRCLFPTKFFQLVKGNHYNTDRWDKYMKNLYNETYDIVFYDILPNTRELIGIKTIKETNILNNFKPKINKLDINKLDNIVINRNKPLNKKKLLKEKNFNIKIFIDIMKDYKKILPQEKNEELLGFLNYKIKKYEELIAYIKDEIKNLK